MGGDTTAGPLNLCLTVFGQVPAGQALRRDGARVGDDVWVSGALGHARLALGALRGEWTLPPQLLAAARTRLECPTPRIALGLALRGIAHSAADVSDGLAGDLGHILRASAVGACLDAQETMKTIAAGAFSASAAGLFDRQTLLRLALTGGDDYELVFTAPPDARSAVQAAGQASATPLARIGRIEAEPGLRLLGADGRIEPLAARAFDHFAP